MGHRIGTKGQVVIAKEIRDQLGIGPGWETIQRVIDGRVYLSFLPPPTTASRRGSLAQYTTVRLSAEELHEARLEAATAAAQEKANDPVRQPAIAD